MISIGRIKILVEVMLRLINEFFGSRNERNFEKGNLQIKKNFIWKTSFN